MARKKNGCNTTIIRRDYVAIADGYRDDVIAGRIRASKWVRLACEREKRDRERSGWEYQYKPQWGVNACRFIEALGHVKGQWARNRERIVLQPWQVFLVMTVFSWCETGTDYRRFRQVYLETARRQGKSLLSAAVALYELACSGEAGGELYSAATTRDQARIIWEISKSMVERDGDLRSHFNLATSAHAIYQTETSSSFKALSAEGNSLDGLNSSMLLIDELHAHRTRKVYDVLETSKGSRRQPLLWTVTTAGSDRGGICFEVRGYMCKVLENVRQDERVFAAIYCLDDDSDWTDESNWVASNPNLGVSMDVVELRQMALKAAATPAALSNFLTKHMSMWVSAEKSLFNIQKWVELGDPHLTLEMFKGMECYAGVDLAPRHDLCAKVLLFEDRDTGHFYAFASHYLNEAQVAESTVAEYSGWAGDGWIQTCPGNSTSYEMIEDELDRDAATFYVRQVLFDPFSAHQFAGRATDRGHNMIEMRPSVLNFSEATKRLDSLIMDGKIHHNGDPVFSYCISNCVGHFDAKSNVYPRKEREEQPIDSAIALIMCLSRSILEDGSGSIYNNPESVWIT